MIKVRSIHTATVIPVPTLLALIPLHLEKCGEMLGSMLGTIHNLRYYQRFTQDIRDALDNDRFDAFVEDFYARRGLRSSTLPPRLIVVSICAW